MISRKVVGRIGLIIGPLLFLFVVFIPLPSVNELPFESKIVLATTGWMAVWWITEAITIYVTALLPLVLFPSLYVTNIGHTSANYADRVVVLFLGGFLLAKAVERSNLHTRFALHILGLFGTNPKYIVAAFILVTGLLSAWLSNTATTMLMLPIASAVIAQL
jgi:sodium-dependent dicarboxylate transporter 2/3/5